MEKIDLKDKKILYELNLNSRQSFRSIGRKVGLSKDMVISRVNKLVESGIIYKFYTEINMFKLGYTCFRFYISFQNTTQEKKEEIIDYFINSKHSIWIATSRGEYDLIVYFLFKNMDGFFSFWRKTQNQFRNYFLKQAFSVYNQYRIYNYRFLFDNDFYTNNKKIVEKDFISSGGEIVKIDDLDFKILKLLTINARISTTEIAHELKSNAKTIATRIKKLKDLEVIQSFTIYIDSFALDYYIYKANIQLSDYNKRAAIIRYIVENPALLMIDESAGYVDLELNFIVKDTKLFYQIMEDLNLKFPNIMKDYTYFYIEKFQKLQFIPDE